MIHSAPPPMRRALGLLVVSLLLLVPAWSQPDRTFQLSPQQAIEARTLLRILEEAHYNREAVGPEDFREAIPQFMRSLDGQHLFFLADDLAEFRATYADGLYWNLATLGRVDAGFAIFQRYEQRVMDRVAWIFARLEQDFDLDTPRTYVADRRDEPWPASLVEADDVWDRRLTFDLVQELLNDKELDVARTDVRKRYERMLKNVHEIETDEVSELFLASVANLYDPHSTYFSPSTYEDFGIQMRLQLVGIGALLGLEDGVCVVREVITGGPADLDGRIRPNDRILAVGQDGEAESVEIIGMKLRRIVELIRGEKGTSVHLTIQPAAAADPSAREHVTLTRNVVNLDSARARGAIFDVPDARGDPTPIGVITLPAFYGPDASNAERQNSAAQDVAELILRMQREGIEGLVLDLRNNGGGLLSEAIELTGLFIPGGPVVQIRTHYGDVKIDEDPSADVAYAGPLAVMVSRFSASASEIVAGALQNYGRAVILGDISTHGKGTVQTVVELRGLVPQLARNRQSSGAAKLTIQKFYLPSGSSTQINGVVPDIVLPSIENHLPVGEGDLPRALVWDEIPTAFFEGEPLPPELLAPLREASLARQASLEEFSHLDERISWFRSRQERREISLNLSERRAQREADRAYGERMDEEIARLRATNYPFREFSLGPPAKPPAPPEPALDLDEEYSGDEDVEGYARLDIQLREALRVIGDAVELQRELKPGLANRRAFSWDVATRG
jgi:carboxyl-terminal processing protease